MKIKRIKANKLKRFKELKSYLRSANFSFTAPCNPDLRSSLAGDTARLDFFDKFKGKRVKYKKKHVKPPKSIYFRGGNWKVLNKKLCVAFGGTSSATADAYWLTELLAQIVVQEGGVVISGGAVGIDTAAHMGALDKKGSTVAVLGKAVDRGLDHDHEAPRRFLEKGILKRGGLVSEYSHNIGSLGERVLSRDRLITGLADVFVAVECKRDSATVDTAKRAFKQGRAVFAIQWDFVSQQWREPEAAGNIQLFREGIAYPIPSRPIRTLEDVGKEFQKVLKKLKKYRFPNRPIT